MIPLRDNIPSRAIPIVGFGLIAINILVFVYQAMLAGQGAGEQFIFSYGVVPGRFGLDPFGEAYTLISSQFLHGGFMHILGNMLYLYIFGDNVEDRFGHAGFLIFYLVCGACAALAQIYFNQESAIPMVGASGAIAGVLGAYFIFYPRARVLTLIPLGVFSRMIEIPAFFFLGFWFLMQTFSGTAALYTARTMGREVGGVAWWAHAGGFVAGLAAALIKGRRRD